VNRAIVKNMTDASVPDTAYDTRNLVDAYKGQPVEAIAADMAARSFPVHVAIENPQHDFNIGTIVRNANAFNVAGVHIVGRRHWNKRGAMSTEKYLQVHQHATVEDFVKWCAEASLAIDGIDNVPGSIMLGDAALAGDVVYVFGQEGPGISVEMRAHCRHLIAIEQFGSTRSVNVGVASGIFLYEWVRRHRLSANTKSGNI
jgi:tRNA G18 (ribose-2'-O)-methylase SpoU